MTLEQILNEGYLVAADDWMNVIVHWNGSATYVVYRNVEDAWVPHDRFILGTKNTYDAKQKARHYLNGYYNDMAHHFGQAA